MKIWKFGLTDASFQTIAMPIGAITLHVAWANQGTRDGWCLWALVDPEAPLAMRGFSCLYTGDSPDVNTSYISTIAHTDGLVYHFFEYLP